MGRPDAPLLPRRRGDRIQLLTAGMEACSATHFIARQLAALDTPIGRRPDADCRWRVSLVHALWSRIDPEAVAVPYKFRVGEIVTMRPAHNLNVPGGVYEIVQRLPGTSGEPEYRIKSANEPHRRLARESELTKVSLEPQGP
jgi:hypothetical protein